LIRGILLKQGYIYSMNTIINTPQAPAPIGPYSQAVLANNTLYISGQIALHPSTGELVMDNIATETHQVMHNAQAILQAAGFTFADVVKCTILLSDMGLFTDVNAEYFASNPPARETFAVKGLPKNVNVEISMIAVKA
jgi:2-iminobutanoate/2-iminopropanoate deaminase